MLDSGGKMFEHSKLPGKSKTEFRVMELFPGKFDDPISCTLHVRDWHSPVNVANPLEYEAVSYAWGDPNVREKMYCDGKLLEVTRNLHIALKHLRYNDRSRMLWADAVCINQADIPERNQQVSEMLELYQKAKMVVLWLGPDSKDQQAKLAVDSINKISDFLCEKLEISPSEPGVDGKVYQEYMLQVCDRLPAPNKCDFSSKSVWESLVWFYSHPYFTRVWVIQEIPANKNRLLHSGSETVSWNRVDMVASYILSKPEFAKTYGFSDTHCWWAATIAEMSTQPEKWLETLYLASVYHSKDERDRIYGLLGLMKFRDGGYLLKPDYNKSCLDLYRDSVKAALLDNRNTKALLYITGEECNQGPSWVPRWDVPMMFRNPFRFGKPMPWKPSGNSEARWKIDEELNQLTLTGHIVGRVESSASYNQRIFCDTVINAEEKRHELREALENVLQALETKGSRKPLDRDDLIGTAVSFSFGLDDKVNIADKNDTLRKFVACLRLALDEKVFNGFISPAVAQEAEEVDGHAFGKPVWDFQYPQSSFFVTGNGLNGSTSGGNNFVGCAICVAQQGDAVFVPLGSTYPLILRPDGEMYILKGYSYVHGIMHGEAWPWKGDTVDVRLK